MPNWAAVFGWHRYNKTNARKVIHIVGLTWALGSRLTCLRNIFRLSTTDKPILSII